MKPLYEQDPTLDQLLDSSLFYDSNIYYDEEDNEQSGSFSCAQTCDDHQELILLN